LVATDPKEAMELRHQIGDWVYDNTVMCPIALKDAIYAASDRVEGWQMNSGVRFPHNLEYVLAVE
jgi:hypothetical protein